MVVAHRLLSSAVRINDDNDWPVHSLLLSLRDLHGIPVRRMIFGSSYWQMWPNHDKLRRLTVKPVTVLLSRNDSRRNKSQHSIMFNHPANDDVSSVFLTSKRLCPQMTDSTLSSIIRMIVSSSSS